MSKFCSHNSNIYTLEEKKDQIECICNGKRSIFSNGWTSSQYREWNLILEEWREQQRYHQRKRITLNGPLLAQFLRELEGDETLVLQQQQELEEQAQREALLASSSKHGHDGYAKPASPYRSGSDQDPAL